MIAFIVSWAIATGFIYLGIVEIFQGTPTVGVLALFFGVLGSVVCHMAWKDEEDE